MPDQERLIDVAEDHEVCATRERAKAYYPRLLDRLEAAPNWDQLVLAFDRVEFVSSSFMDETLVRLASDRPDLATRVCITGLPEDSARRLRSTLRERDLEWTLATVDSPAGYVLRR